MKYQTLLTVGGAVLTAIIITASYWIWIIMSPNPLKVPGAVSMPWPVVCTIHSCVTTMDWIAQQKISNSFSQGFDQPTLTPAQTLSTVIRRQLVSHNLVKSPFTDTDAHKYRIEILGLTDDNKLLEKMNLTGAQYDHYIVLPFLEQEALRQEKHLETTNALYTDLATKNAIFVCLRTFKWDKTTGQITPLK